MKQKENGRKGMGERNRLASTRDREKAEYKEREGARRMHRNG